MYEISVASTKKIFLLLRGKRHFYFYYLVLEGDAYLQYVWLDFSGLITLDHQTEDS